MVGMVVPTTVDSTEARNRPNMIPIVTRMIRLRDIKSFQGKTGKGSAIIPQNKNRDWSKMPVPDLFDGCKLILAGRLSLSAGAGVGRRRFMISGCFSHYLKFPAYIFN
jgi:hypothetical protein